MKVQMENVLTAVRAVVLPNRNAIGRAHSLHCGRDARKCRHQWTCKIAINLIDVWHVADRNDEHVTQVTGLLIAAREYRSVAVAKRHNTWRQFAPQNATKHA